MAFQYEKVLITGGTSGIGLEMARIFARRGCSIALVARKKDQLEAAKAELLDGGALKVICISQDLSVDHAADSIKSQLDGQGFVPEVLVNDAGLGYDCRFVESDPARQDLLEELDVRAVRQMTRAFAPAMVECGHGAILNVASMAGFMAGPFMATYYASKAYVLSLTQALHTELLLSGVHVTALCPGPVKTEFWNKASAGHTALAFLATSPKRVARAAVRGLSFNKTIVVPGLLPKLGVFVTRLVPRSWMALGAAALQLPKRKKHAS